MERPGKDLGCGCEDDKCSNMSGTFSIMNEFKQVYEDKMRIIDGEGSGDCNKQAKINLQQDWIRDLTEQNDMLIRAVDELEVEATERVRALEQKLMKTSKNASQVMSGYKDISVDLEEKFQETEMVRGDLRRLLEFLHRGCENGFWSANGFEFYTITREDLEFDAKRLNHLLNGNRQGCDDKTLESLREKEGEIEDLRRKLEECSQVKCMQETEHLRQSMLDMRDALTAEVADKHDTIVSLKREVQLLEDQCRKADQQTHFKDDIIKELRKEIKQFKQEKAECNQFPNVSELEEENEELKNAIQEATDRLDEFQRTIDVYVEENTTLQQETKEFLRKIEQLETENAMLSENCCNMQTKAQRVSYYEELSLQSENLIQTMQVELEDVRRQYQNAQNEICDLNCQLQQRQLPPMQDMSVQCMDRVPQPRHHRQRQPSDDFKEDSDYDDLVDCTATCGSSPPLSPKRNLREKSPRRLMIKDSSDTDSSGKMLVLCKPKSKSGSETQDTTDASLIDGIEEKFEKTHIENELSSAGTDGHKKTWKAAKKVGKRVVKTIINDDEDEDVRKLRKKYKKVKNCSKRKQRQKALRDRCDIFSDTSLSHLKTVVATTVSSQEFEQPTWNQLQGAVDGLKDSVSRMMVKESEVKLANRRIAELEEQVQLISKKDELITVQNDTLNIVENELQAWRTMETEVEAARCCREKEIANLKETICTLGNNLQDEKDRCQNLQKAVDLYLNTIAVLESSENDLKREISEQRTIIGTLQEALVVAKQGLEESRVRSGHEFGMLIRVIDTLRDENLALEEDLFYNRQDAEISETRLLKYQTMFRELKDECAQLQKDVVALRDQKENQCMFVDELNYQLVGCKDELMRLYKILTQEQEIMEDESLKLTEHVGMLQVEIGKLSQQLNYTVQCADMEKQTKVSLEVTLAKKDCEIICLRKELYVLGEKLKMSAKELSDANEKLVHLQQCKETNICKLEKMAEAMANTKQEFEMLSAEYTATVNNLKNVQMELQCCKTCTADELKQYKDMAANLKEKLISSEGSQKCLERELTCVRSKLEKTIENEAKLLQEKILRDNDFSTYQMEHDRSLNVIANLEQRIALLNCEGSKREQEIGQMKNDFNNQILTQREESCKLKNEINNLVQKQTTFKTENEKLQSQLSKLRTVVSQNDETNHIMARELEQCVTDLSGIQREKQFLIEKNNALAQEIRALQDACQIKTESVVTLEMELNDTKCIKETLCSESRNVIDNVKSWLHEQRKINGELDNKIKFKNSIIETLNGKIATLENKVRSLQRPKQRSSPVVNSRFPASSSGCYWSLGSVESPPCSFNGSETDWETVGENESTPQVWLHRVESLTQELQKNSRYWESKMEEVDYVVSRDN